MTKKNSTAPASFGVETESGSSARGYIFVAVFVGVIILGAAFVLLNNNQRPQAQTPATNESSTTVSANSGTVQTLPILSREHVNPGDTHPAYNSNPPTNGWHYPDWADWGIYADTIPDEYLIHNLEHGGIWISYRDSDNTELISQLQQLVSTDSDRVIMTYRPADDSPISVAAWGVLLNLDQFDAASIEAFIQKYRYQGPENVP